MRSRRALSEHQIAYCATVWENLGGVRLCGHLDVSEAKYDGSETRYNERTRKVYLGADVYPNSTWIPADPIRYGMSNVAVLAHELAHAVRHQNGFNRSVDLPDKLIDEAETSLEASFNPVLEVNDRKALILDAKDQIVARLAAPF